MPRDIAPVTRALDDATAGTQSDVYGMLAAWNQSIETALNRGGGSRFREVMGQYLEDILDVVDAAATNGSINWDFLQECVDAYPPGVGDHHCSPVLANVVARCVIRTRLRDGVDTIPIWALEYLADITMDDDSEWAWESAAAFGWAVGHSEIAVLDRALERAENGDESRVMGILTHVTFADPAAGVDLLERLLQSPDVIEDLILYCRTELRNELRWNIHLLPSAASVSDTQLFLSDSISPVSGAAVRAESPGLSTVLGATDRTRL